MAAQEIRVPDIGDFTDVPIIEILVSPGDTVAAEDPLLTLESDKATLDVPSPVAGTVTSLALSVGDKKKDRHLLFHVPADGAYYIELTEGESKGGAGYNYRLTVLKK